MPILSSFPVCTGGAGGGDSNEVKDYILMKDAATGFDYAVYMNDGVLVTEAAITGIVITTPPNRTEYILYEHFNPNGMVVRGVYSDGSMKDISDYTWHPENITYIDNALGPITITYTHPIFGEFTAEQPVSTISASELFEDFSYSSNSIPIGTYLLNGWGKTYKGEPSTKMIFPDSDLIRI